MESQTVLTDQIPIIDFVQEKVINPAIKCGELQVSVSVIKVMDDALGREDFSLVDQTLLNVDFEGVIGVHAVYTTYTFYLKRDADGPDNNTGA